MATSIPWLQRIIALVAIVFGGLTLFVGSRVLLGNDPGYVVYRPLLLYNVAMGAVYVLAGMLIWRGTAAGRGLAGLIFVLNAIVLAGVVYLYQGGAAVAVESVRAMSLRTGVWLVLFGGLVWLSRRPGVIAGAR
ncbi:hypothetical protein [Ottowia sp.]|uniref:hypothetical protein n=1 Tax=Ottowia sp. TaxID=1898956 RepID=UPI002C290F7C|nr:hypothetical protein [Ottowia sp.]HRN74417.1 hypothetical protein [Ottowia sp.]